MSIGQIEKGTDFRVILPEEPLPKDYLMDLGHQFRAMGIVKRAFYALFEHSGECSYIIMLDLEVPQGREAEAIRDIALSIRTYGKAVYRGERPLDFLLWKDDWACRVLAAAPQLQFFERD